MQLGSEARPVRYRDCDLNYISYALMRGAAGVWRRSKYPLVKNIIFSVSSPLSGDLERANAENKNRVPDGVTV